MMGRNVFPLGKQSAKSCLERAKFFFVLNTMWCVSLVTIFLCYVRLQSSSFIIIIIISQHHHLHHGHPILIHTSPYLPTYLPTYLHTESSMAFASSNGKFMRSGRMTGGLDDDYDDGDDVGGRRSSTMSSSLSSSSAAVAAMRKGGGEESVIAALHR